MTIIISALHFAWRSIDECFARAKNDLRLDGVELSFHESFARPHCLKEDIEALAAARQKHGVRVYAHIWENVAGLGPEAAVRQLDFWRDVAARTGVRGLVIHGGSYPVQLEGIERTALALARAAPGFDRAGVELYLENHYAYDFRGCQELFSEVWEFAELFRHVQSPALRFCFDTGHAHMTKNGEELLRGLAPHLAHVHLADNHGLADDHCMYGEGTVPWERYLDVLCETCFDGTFCVEFPVREDRRPFDACVRDLRRRWKPAPPDGMPGGAATGRG